MLKTIISGHSGYAFVVAEAALSSGIKINYYSKKRKLPIVGEAVCIALHPELF